MSTDNRTLGTLSNSEIARQLSTSGLRLQMGPFVFCIVSSMPDICSAIGSVYRNYPLAPSDRMADFHVQVDFPNLARRWYHPQVVFRIDDSIPYKPYPAQAAVAMMEWGLNWTIFSNAHQYLLIHAASLEKQGKSVILAGEPGSGKSTLCAAMAFQGAEKHKSREAVPWRLMTDEITIVDKSSGKILPLARPICLKNAAIDIIEQRFGNLVVGPRCYNTAKGTVAHISPSDESIRLMNQPSTPRMILFPKYDASATETQWCERSKAETMILLGRQSFNYSTLGTAAFEAMGKIIENSLTYEIRYSNLDEILLQIDAMFDDMCASDRLHENMAEAVAQKAAVVDTVTEDVDTVTEDVGNVTEDVENVTEDVGNDNQSNEPLFACRSGLDSPQMAERDDLCLMETVQ